MLEGDVRMTGKKEEHRNEVSAIPYPKVSVRFAAIDRHSDSSSSLFFATFVYSIPLTE